jgi:DNA-binding response OmpR family regulator
LNTNPALEWGAGFVFSTESFPGENWNEQTSRNVSVVQMSPDRSTLLLADDDPTIADSLAPFLERAGFHVLVVSDGVNALEKAQAHHPELIILDVLMPRMDGREVLRRLRRSNVWTPTILLTQVGEASERALALEEGADDYLNKPFDPHELLARIRAVLRRARPGERSLSAAWLLTADGLSLDRRARRAILKGKTIDLTPKALAVLEYLMTHPDEAITRERLLEAVWGWEYPAGTRTVDTRMAELRRALDDDPAQPRYIETISGEGYRFTAHVEGEG